MGFTGIWVIPKVGSNHRYKLSPLVKCCQSSSGSCIISEPHLSSTRFCVSEYISGLMARHTSPLPMDYLGWFLHLSQSPPHLQLIAFPHALNAACKVMPFVQLLCQCPTASLPRLIQHLPLTRRLWNTLLLELELAIGSLCNSMLYKTREGLLRP